LLERAGAIGSELSGGCEGESYNVTLLSKVT
jgi:hypothetical protein